MTASGERQIVCGAQNFKAGDKVPLILPGQTLPAKAGRSRRSPSRSAKFAASNPRACFVRPTNLGLPDKVDGLLILREDATVGQPFAEYLGRPGGDVVYDLEITPNRPDWNSVIGIAREISALTGNPLRLPEIQYSRRRNQRANRRKNLSPCALSSRSFARVTPRASCAASKSAPARIGCVRPWKKPACAASTMWLM